MRRRHRSDPRLLASCLAVAAVLGAVLAPAVIARDNSWTLTRTPPSIHVDEATTIAFHATNTSDGGGGGEIGCIEIAIPSVFSVGAVSVTSEPSGANWTDSKAGGPGGSTIVRLRAANDDSVLEGDPQNDELGFTIRVTGSTPGVTTWPADAFKKIDCDNDMEMTLNIKVTVSQNGQATPTPAPTPTPTPTPTPRPTAAPTPTPTPAATPTPAPTATPTGGPIATATPTPRPTATPTPGRPQRRHRPRSGLPLRQRRRPPPCRREHLPRCHPRPGRRRPPARAHPPASVAPTASPSSDPGAGPIVAGPIVGVGGGGPPPGTAFTFEGGSGAGATEAGMFSDTFAAIHRDVRPCLRLGGPGSRPVDPGDAPGAGDRRPDGGRARVVASRSPSDGRRGPP